jgi:DNA-binding transcriptional regulator YhcF (GntR family)
MIIGLDPHAGVPPYEQVRDQLAAAIESGDLAAEQRLPTVRQLAADLGLAVNTVARAYRELELAGLVDGRGRHGSFVAGSSAKTRPEAVRATRDFAARMRQLGVGPHEILAIVRRELEDDLAPPPITVR